MNLKVRLAFLYSLSVFIILVASAVSIYFLTENFRKEEFYKRLAVDATQSLYLFEEFYPAAQNKQRSLKQQINNTLPHEKFWIIDSAGQLLFTVPEQAIHINFPKKLFESAKKKKYQEFTIGKSQAVIIYREIEGSAVYGIVAAIDVFGNRKAHNLKLLLISSVLGGLVISAVLAFFYVKQAMHPLEELKEQIGKINEKNLKERVTVSNTNTEVAQIASKFNAMLDRLALSFEQRKNFVQHASHELRTPLTNMLLQTEAALGKDLHIEAYKQTLLSLKEEQQNLIDLTNSLLTLSRYEKLTDISDKLSVRIDDVLYQTIEQINQLWPNSTINIDFATLPQNENELTVLGNESLIKSAIQNLVKNALQYSEDSRVKIIIDVTKTGINLVFENAGQPLSLDEQSRLFIPFFRGENAQHKKGYGLGLSIVQRIITVHNGHITYQAAENKNRFTIFLPTV